MANHNREKIGILEVPDFHKKRRGFSRGFQKKAKVIFLV